MRRLGTLVASVGLLLTGCGQAVILPGPAEQIISRFVSGRTGFHPPDVRCPSNVPAKAGRSFTCHFTGPDGKDQCHFTGPDGSYTADVQITGISGASAANKIVTRRTGP